MAIALDPFGFELMNAKMQLLQHLDDMQSAINLVGEWRHRANSLANEYAGRILGLLNDGMEIDKCVDAVGPLSALHRDQSEGRRQLAILQDLCQYAQEDLASKLESHIRASA